MNENRPPTELNIPRRSFLQGLAATFLGKNSSVDVAKSRDGSAGSLETTSSEEVDRIKRYAEHIHLSMLSALHTARSTSEAEGSTSFVVRKIASLSSNLPPGTLASEQKIIEVETMQDHRVNGWEIESWGVRENDPRIMDISLISPDGEHVIKKSVLYDEAFTLIPPHSQLLSHLLAQGEIDPTRSVITFYRILFPPSIPKEDTSPEEDMTPEPPSFGPYSNRA